MLPIPFNNPRTYKGHSGVDFPQPRGTPIRASGPGEVVRVWKNSKGGWWTTVKYDNGPRTGYAHQDKKPSLKVGQRVNLGDVIGHVGSLGLNSTGPHLHMEISYEPGYDKVWKYFTANECVGQEAEGLEMANGELADNDHNQRVIGKAIQRALKFDARPNGYGADWKLGPTLWERLNQLESKIDKIENKG